MEYAIKEQVMRQRLNGFRKAQEPGSVTAACVFFGISRKTYYKWCRLLPVAIQRFETDHGSEFGTDLTWHLHDIGIAHRYIPRGSPESNGKVERSNHTDEEKCYRQFTFRSPQEWRTAGR